jgi:hypothetical protein
MAPGGAVRGGSVRPWRRQAGERGKVAGRGRRGVGATDKRDRAATVLGGQWQGAGGREKSEVARRRADDMRARPAQCWAAWFEWNLMIFTDSNGFKNLQTLTEIEHGQEAFEIRVNFPHRNFSRFEIQFELKFREVSMGRI